MLRDILVWLDQSAYGQWVTQSPSLFAFPGMLLLHTIGMALVVGIAAGIDLRILGFAPAIPLAPMKKYIPVLWTGFWLNAATGTLLLLADASTKMTNPDFGIKMGFIVLAVLNFRLIEQKVFGDPRIEQGQLPPNAKILAATSLVFWLGAITAGRLLAYVGPVTGLQ